MSEPLVALRERMGDVGQQLERTAQPLLDLMRQTLVRAHDELNALSVAIMVATDDGEALRFLLASGPVAEKLLTLTVPMRGSIAGYVFGTGQVTSVGNLPAEKPSFFYPEVDRQVQLTTQNYLAVPAIYRGRVEGVFTCVNRPGDPPYRPFEAEELVRASALASVQGVLLHYWQWHRQLTGLAERDLLAALGSQGQAASPTGGTEEPWARILVALDDMPREDQELSADLVGAIRRHRQE